MYRVCVNSPQKIFNSVRCQCPTTLHWIVRRYPVCAKWPSEIFFTVRWHGDQVNDDIENIEERSFVKLDLAVEYTADTPYQTFFKQFRAGFIYILRKRGDVLAYKNDQQLTEDEVMSPTLEASIVLWALERIDARLPKNVKKNYGHQMVNNKCLVSLQPTIFQNIGALLLELDEVEFAQAARCSTLLSKCNLISTPDPFRAPSKSMKGRHSKTSGSWTVATPARNY